MHVFTNSKSYHWSVLFLLVDCQYCSYNDLMSYNYWFTFNRPSIYKVVINYLIFEVLVKDCWNRQAKKCHNLCWVDGGIKNFLFKRYRTIWRIMKMKTIVFLLTVEDVQTFLNNWLKITKLSNDDPVFLWNLSFQPTRNFKVH